MNKIITEDGSESFFNEEFQESYHSKSGAVEEAREKYANAIKAHDVNSPIIFDMFFGLGYNAAAVIDEIRENNNDSFIEVHCFENDENILKKILEVNPDFKSYSLIKEFVRRFLESDQRQFTKDNIHFLMYFGDATKLIRDVQDEANFVLFDPFSPKKHPAMWIFPFLKDVNGKMVKGGILATYSCAKEVRKNLELVGFTVKDGPIVGRNSPGTIAIKTE